MLGPKKPCHYRIFKLFNNALGFLVFNFILKYQRDQTMTYNVEKNFMWW